MSASKPTCSVALATYNGERFLQRQLETLAQQSQLPSELVVCDDQSSDTTAQILAGFARWAPFPVRVHVNAARLGYRRNFRLAASMCTSELIFFCDQDDIWLPRKIEQMAAVFEDPAVLLAYHNAAIIDQMEQITGRLYLGAEERALLHSSPPHPWQFSFGLVQAFRRSLTRYDDLWDLGRDHALDESDIMAHDRWYFFLALALGGVAFIDSDLVLYRQHETNSFGAPRRQGRIGRLLGRLAHYPTGDQRKSVAAHHRALVLTEVARRLSGDEEARLLALAQHYELLSSRLQRRLRTYRAPTTTDRGAGLARSIVKGDYCGNPWGFNALSVLRDLLSGVAQLGSARTR